MKKYALLLIIFLLLSGCRAAETNSRNILSTIVETAGEPVLPDVETAEQPVLPEEEPTEEPVLPNVEITGQPEGNDPKRETVEKLLASLSLEEKIGQMFFAQWPSTDAVEDVQYYGLGGLLLFTAGFKDQNGQWLTKEQFIQKTTAVQTAANVPLLIGVDEEGGSVARASRNPNLFPEKCKSPQTLFAQGGLDAVRADAENKSLALLELGINVNFAPVADVSTDPEDFIFDRAFGQDAAATSEYVSTVASAMNAALLTREDGSACSIGSVLKHFPGYGNNQDTHTGSALDERPFEQFLQADFLPFQAGINAGAGAVLVSHNRVLALDSALPASLSPKVHQILRENLGFQGAVLTDDLSMGAVEDYGDYAAVLAVLAGNDMIVTAEYKNQIPRVVDAVRRGVIPENTINQAVQHVLEWKFDLGLLEVPE